MKQSKDWHRLSNLDETNRTANCSIDGLVDIIKDNRTKTGFYCGPQRRRSTKLWRDSNAEHLRVDMRQKRYGLSPQQYQEMYEKQNGNCAICKRPYDTLSVDHDHKTLKIRGLLCVRCNTSLGGLGDSVDNIRKVLDYLES